MLKLLREPLVHFLAIGALLFVLYEANSPDDEQATSTLSVSVTQQERLTAQFTRAWRRDPTPEELAGIIRDYLREEVLYREAVALGLDKNDAVVRRRLRQKMEFLAESGAQLLNPSDEELTTFMKRSADRYRQQGRVAFRHVFLGENPSVVEIDTTREKLSPDMTFDEVSDLGMRTLLPPDLPLTGESRVESSFGKSLASALMRLEPGQWHGPIQSSYGKHFVFISNREPARAQNLSEVREAVIRDWRLARARELSDRHVDELLSRYNVRIEKADAE